MEYEILDRKPREGGHEWMLARIKGHRVQPYVTWMMRSDDNSCHWGHYFDTLEAARADFRART